MKMRVESIRKGFLGKNKDGKILLDIMALPTNELPFDAQEFKKKQRAYWKDGFGEFAAISFKLRQEDIECFGIYRGRKKLIRMPYFDNNGNEDAGFLIANACMSCLYATIKEVYSDDELLRR